VDRYRVEGAGFRVECVGLRIEGSRADAVRLHLTREGVRPGGGREGAKTTLSSLIFSGAGRARILRGMSDLLPK
jgi:hypothetical protein